MACTCSVKLMTFLLNVVRGVPEMLVTETQDAEAGTAAASPTEVEDVEAQEGGAIPPEELVAIARLDSLLRVALRSRVNFCPCGNECQYSLLLLISWVRKRISISLRSTPPRSFDLY